MTIKWAIGGLAAFVLLIVAAYAIQYYTADVRGRVDAQEQRKSGASRIAGYELFFNRCAAIQTNEAQIDALKAELKNTTDPREQARINANITGVTAARNGGINQYNADARKEYTEGQFRDSSLPFQIPVGEYTGRKTSCD